MSHSQYIPNRKKSKTAQPIYLSGRQVAVLRDDRLLDIRKRGDHFVYCKDPVDGSIQRAVCIATETLRQARKANVIQVTDLTAGVKFTIARREFDRRSFDFEGSRKAGLEEQRCCALKYFASNEPKRLNYPSHVEAEPLPAKKPARKAGWKNLDLFSR